MAVKHWIGLFVVLVALSSSAYFMMPDQVKFVVEPTKTQLFYFEEAIGSDWHLLATERMILWDGSAKMRAKNRTVTTLIDKNISKIIREAHYKDNISTRQVYTVNGSLNDIEMIPVSHVAECFNCEGKIVSFEYKDLKYDGETKKVSSPFTDGRLKIEWDDDAYFEKVYNYKTVDSKLLVKYRPESSYEVYTIRMFDPPVIMGHDITEWIPSLLDSGVCDASYGSYHELTLEYCNPTNKDITINANILKNYFGAGIKNMNNGQYTRWNDFVYHYNETLSIPNYETVYYNYTCDTDYFNYTSNPKYAWCYEYDEINDSYNTIFQHYFESGNLGEKTIFWNQSQLINYTISYNEKTKLFVSELGDVDNFGMLFDYNDVVPLGYNWKSNTCHNVTYYGETSSGTFVDMLPVVANGVNLTECQLWQNPDATLGWDLTCISGCNNYPITIDVPLWECDNSEVQSLINCDALDDFKHGYKLNDATDEKGTFDLQNAGTPVYVAGLVGNALNPDASNYLTHSSDSWLENAEMIADNTVSIWFKPDGTGDTPIMQWEKSVSDRKPIAFYVSSGNYKIVAYASDWGSLDSGISPVAGEWAHLVYMRENGYDSLWVNGVMKANQSNNWGNDLSSSTNFNIGYSAVGLIDSVYVWTRALDGDSIVFLNNSGLGRENPLFEINTSYALYNLTWNESDAFSSTRELAEEAIDVSPWNQEEQPTGDAVLHWRLNENAIDETESFNGTVSGATVSDSLPLLNQSYHFDGSNDVITFGDGVTDTSSDFSVGLWVYLASNQQDRFLALADDNDFTLSHDNGGENDGSMYLYAGGWNDLGFNVGYGEWNYYVVTYDESETEFIFYLNGVNVATLSADTGSPYDANYIGHSSLAPDGLIDEFQVWDRVLSQDEIIQSFTADFMRYSLMNVSANLTAIESNGTYAHNDSSTVLDYRFDEGAGTVLHDRERIGDTRDDGIISGAAWNTDIPNSCSDYSLDFSNDYITTTLTNADLQSDFSVVYNVYFDTISARQFVYSTDNYPTVRGLWSDFQTGGYGVANTLLFSVDTPSGQSIVQSSINSISAETWYHVVETREDSSMTIYLNGINDTAYVRGSSSGFVDNSTNVMTIGADKPSGSPSDYFDGHISGFRVYDYALSQAEVNALYNDGNCLEFEVGSEQQPALGPTVTNVNIVPDPAYTNDTLNCTGTVSGGSGVEISTWKWYNESVVISGETSQTLGSGNFSHFDNITCEYTPINDGGTGTPVNSSVVKISDSLPTFVDSPPISDINLSHSMPLSIQLNVTDIDIDEITYGVNDSIVTINASGYITSNPSQSDVGIYNVSVNATSNYYTVNTSFVYNITNAVPVFDEVLTDQSLVYIYDLSYDVNCSDADYDSIEYGVNDSIVSIDSDGLVTSTPSSGDIGSYNITVSCYDGLANTTSSFVYDITSLENFTTVSSLQPTYLLDNETVEGNCIGYSTDGNNFTLFREWYVNDVLNESISPEFTHDLKTTISFTDAVNAVASDDNYLFMAIDYSPDEAHIAVYNRTDFSFVTNLTQAVGDINDMVVDDDYLYAGGDEDIVWVYNLTDLSNPFNINAPASNIEGMHVDDDYLYVGCGFSGNQFYVFNKSDSYATVATHTDTDDYTMAVYSDDYYYYSVGNENILYIYNKSSLTLVTSRDIVYDGAAVYSDGTHVLTGRDDGNVSVFNVGDFSVNTTFDVGYAAVDIVADSNFVYFSAVSVVQMYSAGDYVFNKSVIATGVQYTKLDVDDYYFSAGSRDNTARYFSKYQEYENEINHNLDNFSYSLNIGDTINYSCLGYGVNGNSSWSTYSDIIHQSIIPLYNLTDGEIFYSSNMTLDWRNETDYDWCGYSLNDGSYVQASPNITVSTGNGVFNVTIKCNNSVGTDFYSNVTDFSVFDFWVENVSISPNPAYQNQDLTCEYDFVNLSSVTDMSYIDWYVDENDVLSCRFPYNDTEENDNGTIITGGSCYSNLANAFDDDFSTKATVVLVSSGCNDATTVDFYENYTHRTDWNNGWTYVYKVGWDGRFTGVGDTATIKGDYYNHNTSSWTNFYSKTVDKTSGISTLMGESTIPVYGTNDTRIKFALNISASLSGEIITEFYGGYLNLTDCSVLDSSYFNHSQNVSCNVTPNDGVINGTMVSDSIVISSNKTINFEVEGYIDSDSKYEIGTSPELRCWLSESDTDINYTDVVDLNIKLQDYGTNFTSGAGVFSYNFTIPYAEESDFTNFTGENLSLYVNVTDNGSFYFTLKNWSDVINATFDVYAYDEQTDYLIDILDDGVTDFYLRGVLSGSTLTENRFSDDSESKIYNLLTSSTDIEVVTLSTVDVFTDNISLSMNASASNPVELSYTEWWNGSDYTYYDDGDFPVFVFDDILTEVSNRWNYEQTDSGVVAGHSSSTGSVYANSSTDTAGVCGASGESSYYEINEGWVNSKNLNLENLDRVDFFSYLYSYSDYGDSGCDANVGAQATSKIILTDATGGELLGTLIACYVWDEGADEKQSSDDDCEGYIKGQTSGAIVSLRRENLTNQWNVYWDNVYKKTINIPVGNVNIEGHVRAHGYCDYNGACSTAGNSIANAEIRYIQYGGFGSNYSFADYTYSDGFYTYQSTILLDSSPDDTISVIPSFNTLTNPSCDIDFFVSADNGTNWKLVTSGAYWTFDVPGTEIVYKIEINQTDNETTPCAVYDAEILVPATYVENVTIYFGDTNYDASYAYDGVLNETNTPATFSFSSQYLADYIKNSCDYSETTCDVPMILTRTSGSSGLLTIYNLSFPLNVSELTINGSVINEYLNDCEENCTISNSVNNSDGNVEFRDLSVKYYGSGNMTVGCSDVSGDLSSNYTFNVRYSPVNVSYGPNNIESVDFYPLNVNHKNLQPYGQTSTTPIFTVDSLAGEDVLDLYMYYTESIDSCFTIWANDEYDYDGSINVLSDTLDQLLCDDVNVGGVCNVWMWVNLTACTTVGLPNFEFNTLCDGCVRTSDALIGD